MSNDDLGYQGGLPVPGQGFDQEVTWLGLGGKSDNLPPFILSTNKGFGIEIDQVIDILAIIQARVSRALIDDLGFHFIAMDLISMDMLVTAIKSPPPVSTSRPIWAPPLV